MLTCRAPVPGRYPSAAAEARGYAVFVSNLAVIASINRGEASHVAGVGPFADLSPTEFLGRYTAVAPQPLPTPEDLATDPAYLGEHRASAVDLAALPESIDWVERGAVTAVKSQRCGNCWTFSACGSLEGAHAISTGVLTNYSEQEFVDCCDTGCNGGWNFNALKFAVNHTVCTLEGFPCTGKGNGTQCEEWESSPCSRERGALVKGSLSGWKSVGEAKWGHTTEEDLMSALQLGPVSINMFADSHMAHYKVSASVPILHGGSCWSS